MVVKKQLCKTESAGKMPALPSSFVTKPKAKKADETSFSRPRIQLPKCRFFSGMQKERFF
jgi:hypothetical protein